MFWLVIFYVFVILFRYFMDSNSLSLSPVSFNYVYETCSGKLIELIELRSVAIPLFDRLLYNKPSYSRILIGSRL